jgi:hypothetical protein
MLASDAHGGFGGISQYNRDLIDALISQPQLTEIVVLVRSIEQTDFAARRRKVVLRSFTGPCAKHWQEGISIWCCAAMLTSHRWL